MAKTDALRDHVLWLLDGGNAHAPVQDAFDVWAPELRGARPEGQPHTAWRLLEHMRLAQEDIVAFTIDARHVSPPWPEGYWPANDAPPTEDAWARSVKRFLADLARMRALVLDPRHDLLAPLPGADGATLLREALLLADHNAYHQGQLALLRRLVVG